MDKVDEPEVLVEHAAVVLDARLQVGDAHVLVAVALERAQEGLFGEAGHFLRDAAESLETFRGGRLLELCSASVVSACAEGTGPSRGLTYGRGDGAVPAFLFRVAHAVRRLDGALRCALAVARRRSFRGCERRKTYAVVGRRARGFAGLVEFQVTQGRGTLPPYSTAGPFLSSRFR